jgi:amino acid transporter
VRAERSAGTLGDVGVLSCNGNKIRTTSSGGALLAPGQEYADEERHWAAQARDPAPYYEHSALGYNARMSNLLAALGRAHPQFRTPGVSLLVQAAWSVALLFSGTFDTLTDTLIFVSWFFYAANAWAVVVLRRREPDAPRPFKVPGYPVVPVVFVAFGLIYLVLTLYNDIAAYRQAVAAGRPALMNCALGAALVLSGTPVYFYFRRKKARM